MANRKQHQKVLNQYKRFNLIFYLGCVLSGMSALGSFTSIVSEAMVASSGIMGLVFVGFGYAGKKHYSRR